MTLLHSLYKLRGVVQPYSWGGSRFIPELIGENNNDNKPAAEYWLGAHPKAPSQLLNGDETSFYEAIQSSAHAILGSRVNGQFGTLPYLFKILDVRQMLSIQVHPSIESAIKGYAKEDEMGIPVTAPHRNYKDKNHKPELMVALGDFWLLHGFKSEEALQQIFTAVPALSFLRETFTQAGYKGLYETVMTMPQQRVDTILAPMMQEILPQYKAGTLDKSNEHFWAARAVQTFCKDGHYDRGIFSIYLFNLLYLKEGEGIYQPAGLPHAYLEGQNVEVMANSDNVLRAGLTDKHVDVPELMKHVKFDATLPAVIPVQKEAVQVYNTPAAEFELTKLSLTNTCSSTTESATIFFVMEGTVALYTNERNVELSRGEAAVVMAGQSYSIRPESEPAIIYAVTTPAEKS